MKKKIQNLKGFRDFLPTEAAKREWLKARMVDVFKKWGYEPIETPSLESLELFSGQIGEDEKLFYSFKDQGGREVALRYDQTVPTCRVIGQYFGELVFPFRRYQIQSSYRAEKPQKGRYREFVQADIDIFGVKSELADAEAIALSIDLYLSLGFSDVVIKINNRDLMKGIPYEVINSVDKLNKIGEEGVVFDIKKKGFSENEAKNYLKQIREIEPDEVVNNIFEYLRNYGFEEKNYKFEPTLARSFSYSEGPIWEVVVPKYSGGSVGGGERYDSMVERITGIKVPATGIAFGFDRTLEALEEAELLPEISYKAEVLVTVFELKLLKNSLVVAQKMREEGLSCEVYPDPVVKLGKQIKYADRKNMQWVIVIGPEEVEKEKVQLKNMKSGEQEELSLNQVVERISSK